MIRPLLFFNILTLIILLNTSCLFDDFLTDGATRVANDIREGSRALGSQEGSKYTIEHLPKSKPEGCSENYHLEFVKGSLIGIWCKSASTGQTTSSHVTTSHLNFVDLPKGYVVDKKAGEVTFIELERQNGRATIVGVH